MLRCVSYMNTMVPTKLHKKKVWTAQSTITTIPQSHSRLIKLLFEESELREFREAWITFNLQTEASVKTVQCKWWLCGREWIQCVCVGAEAQSLPILPQHKGPSSGYHRQPLETAALSPSSFLSTFVLLLWRSFVLFTHAIFGKLIVENKMHAQWHFFFFFKMLRCS